MLHSRFNGRPAFLPVILLAIALSAALSAAVAQTQRTPSDVVREFYKAMHERRFKEAWALTIYKPAVDGLNAQEMEDLRPDFEEKAAAIPDQVEISGEQISGDIATVFEARYRGPDRLRPTAQCVRGSGGADRRGPGSQSCRRAERSRLQLSRHGWEGRQDLFGGSGAHALRSYR